MKPLHNDRKRSPFALLIAVPGTLLLCGAVYEWFRKGESALFTLILFAVMAECSLVVATWLTWQQDKATRRAGLIIGEVMLAGSMAAFFIAAWPLR